MKKTPQFKIGSKKLFLPLLLFMISLILTGFAWYKTNEIVHLEKEEKFIAIVTETHIHIQESIDKYINILYGMRGLFAASQKVDRNDFRAYVNSLPIEEKFPGIQALEFIARVPLEDKKIFMQDVRDDIEGMISEGYPDFIIYPEGKREEYFVVTYIEPFKGNEEAFGFDLFSNPARKMALEEARDTNTPVATAPIRLVQEKGEQAGFLIFLPLYKDGVSVKTVQERREALNGFVLAVFRASDFFESLLSVFPESQNLHVEAVDESGSILFVRKDFEHKVVPEFNAERIINVGGRDWKLSFHDLPSFATLIGTEKYTPLAVAVGGVSFSVLLFFVLYSFTRTQVRAERIADRLTKDLKKFQLAVEHASDHIIITDIDGFILYANKAAEKITGYSKKEMIGQRPSLWGKRMKPEFYKKMWNTLKVKKEHFIDQLSNKRKNGEIYDAETHIAPVLDQENNVMFFVGIERDITKEKEIDRAKTEFVSLASHQLKTPSAQIKGFIDNMLSGLTGPLNKKQKEYLNDMFAIADRNSKLIDDLLNVSRLERGMLTADIKNVQIRKILEIALSPLMKMAKEKGVTIKKEYPEENFYILADFDKSVEIIRNIIHNAIGFTKPSSSVTISLHKDRKDVVMSVQDEGEGITPENQKTLFAKEKVLGGKVKAAGAGLGLYLAKQFIDLQGGKINFDTKPGEGTTFYIYFKKK